MFPVHSMTSMDRAWASRNRETHINSSYKSRDKGPLWAVGGVAGTRNDSTVVSTGPGFVVKGVNIWSSSRVATRTP